MKLHRPRTDGKTMCGKPIDRLLRNNPTRIVLTDGEPDCGPCRLYLDKPRRLCVRCGKGNLHGTVHKLCRTRDEQNAVRRAHYRRDRENLR